MSWLIENLLRNSVEIKTTNDINSDEFNDLIVLESKIQELYKHGIISDEEISIIKYIEDGKPMVNSKNDMGRNRISLSKNFVELCDKIAFYLGGYFTDDGYIDYMTKKYNLTGEQIQKMINYMKSKYKNKLIRKSTNTNE